jgi:hypothetical protein
MKQHYTAGCGLLHFLFLLVISRTPNADIALNLVGSSYNTSAAFWLGAIWATVIFIYIFIFYLISTRSRS